MAKTEYTEAELVKGCLLEKASFQTALYHRFSRTMFGVCLRYTRDRMQAEDVLQQGFMKVFRNLHTWRGETLEGWMKRIFIREAVDLYRKENRNPLSTRDEPLDGDSIQLPEIFDHMQMEEILTAIARLPEGCRMVFNLYAVEGYTHPEIGTMLGISPGTSKAQYFRAKELLRQKIYTP